LTAQRSLRKTARPVQHSNAKAQFNYPCLNSDWTCGELLNANPSCSKLGVYSFRSSLVDRDMILRTAPLVVSLGLFADG